jgi:hypothetical protein
MTLLNLILVLNGFAIILILVTISRTLARIAIALEVPPWSLQHHLPHRLIRKE